MARTETAPLDRLAELDARRAALRRQLDELDAPIYAAIADALAQGATQSTIAATLGVSRQAVAKYIDRREETHV